MGGPHLPPFSSMEILLFVFHFYLEFRKSFREMLWKDFHESERPVRFHWGLLNEDTVTKKRLGQMFPKGNVKKFHAALDKFNSSGLFSNQFTQELFE